MYPEDQLGAASEIAHRIDPERVDNSGPHHHQQRHGGNDPEDGTAQLLSELLNGKPSRQHHRPAFSIAR
jgi:hypothetical protein